MATNNSAFSKGELKCHRCLICDGYGCPGNMPGLGGVFENKNFQLNYEGWKILQNEVEKSGKTDELLNIKISQKNLRCGPVTGAVENIGYLNEEDFYYPYLKTCFEQGFGLCVGDGYPDLKLQLGIEALKKINEKQNVKAAFFLKPYPQKRLFERIEWVKPFADFIGIDIDSYNIITMRNLVNLERKTEAQLEEFRKHFEVPFVIKGVFTKDDLQLVKDVCPDVAYISNHGGRVETRIGSTAEFLKTHAEFLKKYTKQIWVDGGIRCKKDIQTALFFGADKVMIARPLIRAVFDNDLEEFKKLI